jgi:hypothetical protein
MCEFSSLFSQGNIGERWHIGLVHDREEPGLQLEGFKQLI